MKGFLFSFLQGPSPEHQNYNEIYYITYAPSPSLFSICTVARGVEAMCKIAAEYSDAVWALISHLISVYAINFSSIIPL
jgi:hypothetical protein